MGYQALLFCPDDKLAGVVSRVFSELDFAVEPVHEPFAAVKKLMAHRYDAIVVDCENEQNASLLFKSARNSSSNQSSLAIALVEGQAGVAKAYRIGANLVLTKPINLEQAKGTLRVARGLLRKNSDAASASIAGAAAAATPVRTAPVSTTSSFEPCSRGSAPVASPSAAQDVPEFEAPLPTAIPAVPPSMNASLRIEDEPALLPAHVAPTKITIASEPAAETQQPASQSLTNNDVGANDGVKNASTGAETRITPAPMPAQHPGSASMLAPGSAAAPAPAKEVPVPPAKENKAVSSKIAASRIVESKIVESNIFESKIAETEPESPVHDALPMFNSVSAADAPSFAALGEEEDSDRSGGNKKLLIAAVIVLALAALGYVGYGALGKSGGAPASRPASTSQDSGPPASALAPMSSPAAPSTNSLSAASSATQPLAPKTATAGAPDKLSAGTSNLAVSRIDLDLAPGKKSGSAPMLVKSNPVGAKTQIQAEESAPQLPSPLAVASANDSNLSGLMAQSSTLPRPALATVKISQGVSQGLLIKRVQPEYPRAALAVHAQGAVQIEATIDKEGNVINPKVLRGDAVLAHAALEAVRQWRYKPYYLDGEPVEIQTQITVNFKAN